MNTHCNTGADTGEYLARFYSIISDMVTGMTEAELVNSISYNFIVQMIPHHRAAIRMSENILCYSCNDELRSIAENIISEQTKSIANMEAIIDTSRCLMNCCCDLSSYQKQMDNIMQTMFYRMRNARTTKYIDADFIREMIPHHMGAVSMSETTLRYCIYTELKPILRRIISSQKKGIEQMQCLLNKLCR